MAQYKLTNIVRKETSTGKAMIKCTANEEPDVAIWSTFANFANLKDGDIVEAELEIKQNGQYLNKTLKSPATGNIRASGGGMGAKLMEKKEASIEKFQTSKENSIKISSTFGKAVDCAIAEFQSNGDMHGDLEELIRKWRRKLWFLYEEHTEYPPFQ